MSPLFEYRCPECASTLEKLEPFNSTPPLCPSCQEAVMERMPSAGTAWKFGGKHE